MPPYFLTQIPAICIPQSEYAELIRRGHLADQIILLVLEKDRLIRSRNQDLRNVDELEISLLGSSIRQKIEEYQGGRSDTLA